MSLSYLHKFNKLPDNIKSRIGSKDTVSRIEDIEKKYSVSGLAQVLMRVAVKELSRQDAFGVLSGIGIPEDKINSVVDLMYSLAKPALESNDSPDKQTDDVLTGSGANKNTKIGEDLEVKPEHSDKLVEVYKKFIDMPEVKQVRLYSNEVLKDLESTHGTGNIRFYITDKRFSDAKNRMYDSINRKEKLEFLKSLAEVFLCGDLKRLFRNDERYTKFWRKRILKHGGFKAIREFDANPSKPEHLSRFIRYVMERRFEIPSEEAVLWGVFVSVLAHSVNDKEYEHLAFGNLDTNTFVWSWQ